MLLLTVASTTLSLLTVVVFPWFDRVTVVLACVTTVLGAFIGFRKRVLYGILLLLLIIPILLCGAVWHLLSPRERHQEYISPSGTVALIMEYNLLSVPSVYIRQNHFMMTAVPMPHIAPYMETVHFSIEWLSDSQICMVNELYDEEYVVDLFPVDTA